MTNAENQASALMRCSRVADRPECVDVIMYFPPPMHAEEQNGGPLRIEVSSRSAPAMTTRVSRRGMHVYMPSRTVMAEERWCIGMCDKLQ